MKIVHALLGILFAFALMFALLITSVEAVAYWIPGYYETAYTKYNVTADVQMELDDLVEVTEEMMVYLRGDREDLHVPTIVNGQPREFFNEREIAHMEDVRGLFLGAMNLRTGCFGIMIICLLILMFTKANIRHGLSAMMCLGIGLFFGIFAIMGGIMATDFTRYFILFHEIFFDNDLWILNPKTDLLINIVPEPFFSDITLHIGIIYGIFTFTCLLISIILLRSKKK